MDCSLSASSVHGILRGRILEWVALPYSRGSSQPRDQTWVSCVSRIGLQILYHLCHREPSISEFAQITVRSIGDATQPSHPLLSPSFSFNLPQHQGLFQGVSSLHQVLPKYWSFSFSINPSKEYSGLISFRINWFDLPTVQGTLKTLPNKLRNQMTQQWNHIDKLYTWDLFICLFIYLFVDLLAMELVGSNLCPPQWEYQVLTTGNSLHMRFSAPLFCICACMLSCFSHIWLFVTPWTIVRQAPLSMGNL